MTTISLCMIVRDEEEVLARCLDSAAGIADEIIIVDTGSVDRTMEIAREYTDQVYSFTWIDDFAAARNYAFSLASSEFCMWLDADDVILPEDHSKLLELKNQLAEVDTVMLRYNTRFENVTVIAGELEQIKNYVTVIKIRFEDRFEVYYDVDEECLDCRILKFTLQPFLENAVSHGLADVESGGMLRIRIKKEEDTVSIMVYDNGTGIPKEKLKELNDRLKKTEEHPLEYIEQYKSLGILNVHLRSRLFYGEGYSFEIFSKEGKGTCISMKIPFSYMDTVTVTNTECEQE